MNRKLPAFTLIELAIAMLISSIVISITYTVYTLVQRSYAEFQKKNQDLAYLIRIDQLLKKDFRQADFIYIEGRHLKCTKRDIFIADYECNPHYLVRKSLGLDTFKVEIGNYTCFFEKKRIDPASFLENTPLEMRRIDELILILTYHQDSIPYHYYKQYSSSDLIHRNTNAVN